MSTDDFTTAAFNEARARYGTGGNREVWVEAAEWARAYLTERCTACGEDPSGPLRPLSTDERSYRYAQDLGYELPEDPR